MDLIEGNDGRGVYLIRFSGIDNIGLINTITQLMPKEIDITRSDARVHGRNVFITICYMADDSVIERIPAALKDIEENTGLIAEPLEVGRMPHYMDTAGEVGVIAPSIITQDRRRLLLEVSQACNDSNLTIVELDGIRVEHPHGPDVFSYYEMHFVLLGIQGVAKVKHLKAQLNRVVYSRPSQDPHAMMNFRELKHSIWSRFRRLE